MHSEMDTVHDILNFSFSSGSPRYNGVQLLGKDYKFCMARQRPTQAWGLQP